MDTGLMHMVSRLTEEDLHCPWAICLLKDLLKQSMTCREKQAFQLENTCLLEDRGRLELFWCSLTLVW